MVRRNCRVQNFELHLILKNCINNNRFLKYHPKWLKIVNPMAFQTASRTGVFIKLFSV